MFRTEVQAPSVDVLIAEDDAITRLALRQMFESAGYRCAEAADGDEAVQIAQKFHPRLVLLDLMMPRHGWIHSGQAITFRSENARSYQFTASPGWTFRLHNGPPNRRALKDS